jgi:hypothetical protein
MQKIVKLDDEGRCCGRKPLVYKRPKQRYCRQCNRAYDFEENRQISNWRYRELPDGSFEENTTFEEGSQTAIDI